MQLVLHQTFPLGRFHATPWKVFPYDDPHGEWPPSPWRLLRAVLARSYQLERECPPVGEERRMALVRAFATSDIAWHLPDFTWRGPGLRQYHPAEFRRVPPSASQPGMMAYNTTKVLDSFWLIARAEGEASGANIRWFLEGEHWTPPVLELLDACLARMTYFGRTESITKIQRVADEKSIPREDLVTLLPQRSAKAVPVLTLKPDATLAQVEASTDDPAVANKTIPPGARWMFFERPALPRAKAPSRPKAHLKPVSFMQFALGSRVAPNYRDSVRLTERFRSRVLRGFAELVMGHYLKNGWRDASDEVREQAVLLSGKDVEGKRLAGHRHAFFFLHGEPHQPTRLCIWRDEPFTDTEQRAILSAAQEPLPLSFDDDPWTVTLVPLDTLVTPPLGFQSQASRFWRTLIPYVPPRHVFDRKGRTKMGDSVEDQIREELHTRGLPSCAIITIKKSGWVKTHQPSRTHRQRTNSDKLGYEVSLEFTEPVSKPIILGNGCHFGLGLFVPVES